MGSETAFARWAQRVEAALEAALPAPDLAPQRLHAAMRHAVLGGGKRMRPLLVYAAGMLTGADEATLDAPAAAHRVVVHRRQVVVHQGIGVDQFHRRGRPTVHVAFDEATAILAGDALQTRAFEVLADAQAEPALRVAWLQTLARASGVAGMCGGQALDIDATGQQQSLAALQRMHALKTGALIRASVRLGALAGGADAATLQRLDRFADALGLAFQVRDDILDVEASSETLGKTAGKDAAQDKSTYPALLGMDGAKVRLDDLAAQMRDLLAPFAERADALAALGELTVRRGH